MNLSAQTSISLSSLLQDITNYKYNPSQIQSTILSYLQNVLNGEVDLVDPSNPFLYALEASTVSTAAAINEGNNIARKLYPALAFTEEELYLHMSDIDFVGRFSSPATGNFVFMLETKSLIQQMVTDPTTGLPKAIISRYTEIVVNGMTFTMQYPIIIQQYPSGNFQVNYDTSETSPLQTISTNMIAYTTTVDQNGTEWLVFNVPILQVNIESSTFPVVSSSYFTQTIDYTDQFYYCRVFTKAPSSTGAWTEIQTTFTDQVFDPQTPTAVLKILNNSAIQVNIPQIYVTNGLVDGDVRIDVYTTKGSIDVNMQNFLLTAFELTFQDLDNIAATSTYRAAMNNVVTVAYCYQTVSGGSNGVDFNTLRSQVINNSIGNAGEPVTGAQLQTYAQEQGFSIVENVDVITNRIYLASRDLPLPQNQPFITPASISIETLNTTLDILSTVPTCNVSNNRAVLLPDTLYTHNNGLLSIYPETRSQIVQNRDAIELQNLINENNFLFTPFYYVLDASGSEFDVRAYDFSSPSASNLGYSSYNTSVNFQVNTGSYNLTQTSTGFQLTVSTKSDAGYKALPNGAVGVQLSFISPLTNERNYINGVLQGSNASQERVFVFNFDTEFDVDSNDYLYVKGNDSTLKMTMLATALEQTMDIVYLVTNIPVGFVAPSFQSLIGSLLVTNEINSNYTIGAITHEQLTLTFGQNLTYLWNSFRSVLSGQEYARYTQDVPMYYQENVYQRDPVTNSIFSFDSSGKIQFTILHNIHDPVLDANGNQVYQHRAGDVMTDANGNPVLLNSTKTNRLVDLLLIEGVFYFVTNPSTVSYVESITQLIAGWATNVLGNLESVLLPNTELYLFPRKSKGQVQVLGEGNTLTYIEASQSFSVKLYVSPLVYKNTTLLAAIQSKATSIINTALLSPLISISQIEDQLRSSFSSDVIGVEIQGLGGAANYQVVVVMDQSNKLSLSKMITKLPDGTLTVEEDITFEVIQVGN